jgi:hypothetical protein
MGFQRNARETANAFNKSAAFAKRLENVTCSERHGFQSTGFEAKMSRILIVLLQLLFISSSLVDSARSEPFNWRGELRLVERRLSTPSGLTRDNCARVIGAWTNRLAALPSAELMPASAAEADDIFAHGNQWLEKFFRVRLLLAKRWSALASPSTECALAMRRALRYSRFAEDFLAEWLLARGAFASLPRTLFGGGAPHTLVDPGAAPLRFESGDILLMRGPKFVSGLLARAGDEEGDFSHLAIIGRDEAGAKYVIEALIESGTMVIPLAEYLETRKEWRVALLRYRDHAVADRAGVEIFRRTQGVLQGVASIPYNFALDLGDETRFYCAQVAHFAYSHATGGKLSLPEFRTSLNKFARSSIGRALKLSSRDIFAPSDIQIDRRFDIVAEFRDPALLARTRHANVAMSHLLSRLRQGDEMKPQPLDLLVASLLLPLVMGEQGLGEQGGSAIDAEGAARLLAAQEAFDRLVDAADAIDAQAIREFGHPLTFRELAAALDQPRLTDCDNDRLGPSARHCELETADGGARAGH